MDEGLDTGDILLAQRLAIGEGMDAGTLHDQLADLGAHAILAALDRLEAGDLAPAPQATTQASYAPKLRREDGALDWGAPAAEIDRRVRALTPWPGAHFRHAGERVKLLAARPLPDPEAGTASAGTLLDAGQALVACGAGALKLERVQRPGRKPVSGPEFLRGARLGAGDRLG